MQTDLTKKVDQKVANFFDKQTDIWNNPDEIKSIFAPNLTPTEFKAFVAMGISLQANPFLKEIFAIKFGTGANAAPAQLVVARDLYRKKAQSLEEYDSHIAEAVYPGENFELVRDDKDRIIGVNHTPEMELRYADPETLPYGAYCAVYKKDKAVPFYVFVPFREYHMTNAKKEYIDNKPTGSKVKNEMWSTKPETMIKKVAEAQGLRGAFQGTFQGTYTPDEIDLNPDMEVKQPEVKMPKKTEKPETKIVPPFEKMKQAIAEGKAKEVNDSMSNWEWPDDQKKELLRLIAESIEPEEGEVTTEEMVDYIMNVANQVDMTVAQITKNDILTKRSDLMNLDPDALRSIYEDVQAQVK